MQTQPASTVLNCRRTYADISGGAPRAVPATQTEVLQVLRLRRKMKLRCFKCCVCHANAARVHSIQSSPDFNGPLWRPASKVLNRRRTSADLSGGAPRAAPATQNEIDVVLMVLC